MHQHKTVTTLSKFLQQTMAAPLLRGIARRHRHPGVMQPLAILCLLLTLCSVTAVKAGGEDAQAALKTEAMIIAKRFGGALKPQLKEALQTGGPAHAIEICSQQAPEIARTLSEETGWEVKRVSLKARNHSKAQPDQWEAGILRRFEQLLDAGATIIDLNHTETTAGQFRYMQALMVEPLCLACHGQQLAPEVAQRLDQYYPQDRATGYSLGQIRGAFSISKKLP